MEISSGIFIHLLHPTRTSCEKFNCRPSARNRTYGPACVYGAVLRAVASMYCVCVGGGGGGGGGVGQKFRNDENISESFMAYEATKVFAIRKMKTQ
jgi:hypothetical protein